MHKAEKMKVERDEDEGEESQTRCCFCRQVYPSQSVDYMIERLTFGVQGKNYIFDPRFNEFESFERACADLDMVVHHMTRKIIFVNKDLVRKMFNAMVQGAREESDESTPIHMQAVRSVDFKFVERAVINATELLHGTKVGLANLFQAILHDLDDEIIQAFRKSGLAQTLDLRLDGLPWGRDRGKFARNLLAPFYVDQAEKLIQRTVKALVVRRCDCIHTDPFHNHGERIFFSPRFWGMEEHIEEIDVDDDSDSDSDSASESDSSDSDDTVSEIDAWESDWSSESGEDDSDSGSDAEDDQSDNESEDDEQDSGNGFEAAETGGVQMMVQKNPDDDGVDFEDD